VLAIGARRLRDPKPALLPRRLAALRMAACPRLRVSQALLQVSHAVELQEKLRAA
jgi:hypothetical protein